MTAWKRNKMSFNVEFIAESPEDAKEIMTQDGYIAPGVTEFISEALRGIEEGSVYVKAVGHFSRKYSNVTIEIRPLLIRHPERLEKG